jgi:hypothetical protein
MSPAPIRHGGTVERLETIFALLTRFVPAEAGTMCLSDPFSAVFQLSPEIHLFGELA